MDWYPLWNSLRIAGMSCVLVFFTGIFCAYYAARLPRVLKGILDVVLTLPMVLPPTVCGYFLLLIFGVTGLLPLVFLILYVYFCVAGRLRDCGKNTYLAWVAIIPLVGFFFVIYLFFPDSKETAASRSPQQL